MKSRKTNLCRTIPAWMRQDPSKLDKRMRRNVLYYLQLWLATPVWADLTLVREIYRQSELRNEGHTDKVEVDHVVPINHPNVCGLHNEFNLQILPALANLHKSNNHWPDMPCEQGELF